MRITLTLYFILCLLVGLSAYLLIRHWRISRTMGTWIPVTARVADATLERKWSRYGEKCRFSCKYMYEYQGVTYTGTEVTPIGVQESRHKEAWFKYLDTSRKTSANVPCFVNPANPREAVLSKSSPGSSLTMLVCGFFGSGIGLALLLWFDQPWRRFRRWQYVEN